MYSIIDVECNGAGFREEKIIEVAIFRFDGHKITDQVISVVNPEAEITAYVQKLTGITPKMVKTAPKFHELAKRIVEITEGTTLVGHNVSFDYRMLRQSFRALGYDFQMDTLDTLPLSKKLIPDLPSYSLGKLCKSVGIPLADAHRAGGDARATLELFKLLISKDVANEILQSHQEQTESRLYINKINELTEELPSEKGLLYFQDKKGKIIALGYADNIYKWARKILTSKSVKNQKLQQAVEQIHYEFTGTEIIAQLMMLEKGIKAFPKKSYQIVYDEEQQDFFISTKKRTEQKTLFAFRYLSQAERFVDFLSKRDESLDYLELKKEISFSQRNELWIGTGRTLGERSFLAFRNGKFVGYGFYELYHQILSWDKIQNLMVPVETLPSTLKNEMQIGLLKGDFEVRKVTQE